MEKYYKVTVNDLYLELKKIIENGGGDKIIKLSVYLDNCDYVQDLRAYSEDWAEDNILLMAYGER